jgi:hypothetical protein
VTNEKHISLTLSEESLNSRKRTVDFVRAVLFLLPQYLFPLLALSSLWMMIVCAQRGRARKSAKTRNLKLVYALWKKAGKLL